MTTSKPIPFYGATHPRLFEIERRCMDRDGVVVDFLDRVLPEGRALDIGAGNGFVGARLLGRGSRRIVGLEPAAGMVDRARPLLWSRGIAQALPFRDASFDAAYATWAYFLAGVSDKERGLREMSRVVRPRGPLVIVDNAGDDEFCALAREPIADGGRWYRERGFERTVLDTSFRFDSIEEARELLSFYFGEDAGRGIRSVEIGFGVAAYVGEARTVG